MQQITTSYPVAIDSGAFALYQKYGAPRKTNGDPIKGKGFAALVNHSYCYGQEFREYLDSYMAFLHVYRSYFSFMAALDVLYNPERSWEVYAEMRAEGFEVMPVYHYGEDFKWLKRYLDSTDYVGIGGLVGLKHGPVLEFHRRLIRAIGTKQHKLHAYGIGSPALLRAYPYYSCDSTGTHRFSRLGRVLIPRRRHNHLDYLGSMCDIPVSDLVAKTRQAFSTLEDAAIDEYLESVSITRAELAAKTQVAATLRWRMNLYYMDRMLGQLAQHNGESYQHYYCSGGQRFFIDALPPVEHAPRLGYLGTFNVPTLMVKICRHASGEASPRSERYTYDDSARQPARCA